jgi:hypothetical protein
LSLLQLLLLLDVPLLQLLRLLLMLLLGLLLLCIVRVLFCQLLMFLILLLLELLPFLSLLLLELLLLLLIFLVRLGVPRVGRSRAFRRWKVIGMNRRRGSSAVFSPRLCRLSISGRVVRSPGRSCRHGIVSTELSRSGRGCDRRLAVIGRRTQFWITAGRLNMLQLRA